MDNVRSRYPGVVYDIWGGCASSRKSRDLVEKVGKIIIE